MSVWNLNYVYSTMGNYNGIKTVHPFTLLLSVIVTTLVVNQKSLQVQILANQNIHYKL